MIGCAAQRNGRHLVLSESTAAVSLLMHVNDVMPGRPNSNVSDNVPHHRDQLLFDYDRELPKRHASAVV